jgi:hypothetical protein
MELLSIVNPPITDLNDARLTSESLLRIIDEQQGIITQRMKELAVEVKKEDMTSFDVMIFACLQHHLHITTLNTKLTARQVDLAYVTSQLNFRLERLTKCLIGLTVTLALFALPLVIDVILKWVK